MDQKSPEEWEHIYSAQIEHRPKEVSHFVEKIQRDGKNYKNPMEEMTDLVGIRIITYYLDDADKIRDMITKEFTIDPKNSIDKAQILDPDKFGYLSAHYVVSLSNERSMLTEWTAFGKLKAEIQVRTVLQHAWASIDHKLRYKTEKDVPKNLRRKLFRLSALLELADEQFLELRNLTGKLEESYTKKALQGKFDFDINLNSLEIYFNSTEQLKSWTSLAKEVGFQAIEDFKVNIRSTENVKSLQRIIDIMSYLGVKTINDFDIILNKIEDGKIALTYFFDKAQKNVSFIVVHPLQVIILFLTYLFKNNLGKEQLTTIGFSKQAMSIIEQIP